MRTPLFLSALALILALVCGVFLDGGWLLCSLLILLGTAFYFVLRRFDLPRTLVHVAAAHGDHQVAFFHFWNKKGGDLLKGG